MKLALDHHYSPRIAEQLRQLDHDVVAAVELGWHTLTDDELLSRCTENGRALMSNNVGDFAKLARDWQESGRSHLGLIFTSDSSMPRSMATIGRYVSALDELLRAHRTDDALRDQIHWLTEIS